MCARVKLSVVNPMITAPKASVTPHVVCAIDTKIRPRCGRAALWGSDVMAKLDMIGAVSIFGAGTECDNGTTVTTAPK